MKALIRAKLASLLSNTLDELSRNGQISASVEARQKIVIEIIDTKQPEHGDFASNLAMTASKTLGMNPRELAVLLQSSLMEHFSEVFEAVEVAGPGFLNFKLKNRFLSGFLGPILASPESFIHSYETPAPLKINVEFVSVNPNGPITIGSGRGAAYGSTLCNVLEAAGHSVHREYYINDGVNSEQMRLFAESVRSFVQKLPFPEKGYKGDYVQAIAEKIQPEAPENAGVEWFQNRSQELMIMAQRQALTDFGVTFDTWFSEQSLHNSGVVETCLSLITERGVADNEAKRTKLKLARGGKIDAVEIELQTGQTGQTGQADKAGPEDEESGGENTTWLRSTKFGDDMDRVLRRQDGRLTYIASDVAYHRDKFNRPAGADKLITVLGPDHHGYIGRLQAVVAAVLLSEGKVTPGARGPELTEIESELFTDLAERDLCQAATNQAKASLEVLIFQLVRFVKDGSPAPMRKRDGNIYALSDLIQEIGSKVLPEGSPEDQNRVGRDVSRFFYLMRHHDTTFDFDLDLASKQSEENPVFYVQYAHARVCSLLAKAKEAGFNLDLAEIGRLEDPRERDLIKKIGDFATEVKRCEQDYGVHRMATYAVELSRAYHHFYDGCRVIQPEAPELTRARLTLCESTRIALRATFKILGISAPERM